MEILPGKERFLELSRHSKRVPICGQSRVAGLDAAALFAKFYKDSPHSFLFESGKGPDATARYTFMGEADSCFVRMQDEAATLIQNGKSVSSDIFAGFDRLNFDPDVRPVDYLPHFWGGWVGYIGYEAGALFENLPKAKTDDLRVPDLYFMLVQRLFVYDRKTSMLKYIIAEENSEFSSNYKQYINEINEVLGTVSELVQPAPGTASDTPSGESFELRSNMTRDDYLDRVRNAKTYIREGDIYQANLSQRFDTDFSGDPFQLYRNLKSINPSPFSGYLNFKEFTIVSSSPERLVKVDCERIETRPIAGTRPRHPDPEKDRCLSAELLLNEKERAEHLMLVDLERNDLGRICKVGSVTVTDLMFLEQYSHVSHIVSNIAGELVPGISVRDILKAVFPGGTITGCPKIRCMEIIDELEPTHRGPYSGSFGYIGFCRQMDFNIIIRTILLKSGKAYFHVGAGIVADSNPEKEYQETLDKAAAMIEVLSCKGNGNG